MVSPLDEGALEQGRRPRGVLADLDEQRREIEGHRLGRRRRRPLDALGDEGREVQQLGPVALPGAPRRDAREPRGDELVVRRLVERAPVRAHRAGVVSEAQLVELRSPRDVPRALLARARVLREPLDGLAQRTGVAVILDDPRDLLRWDGVRRVERASLLERAQRVHRRVQARVLHLRQRDPQRDLLVRGQREVDPRAERLRRELPAAHVFLEAHLERAGGDVARVARQHVPHELPRAGRVARRVRACGARLQREPRRPVVAEARLVDERARQGPCVAASRGRALKAEDRTAPIAVDREHLLVRARGASRVPEQLLPEEGDLLEVRRLAAGVLRLLGRLAVELDERAHAGGVALGGGGRQEPRERVEHRGVARRRDPGGAQVADGVGGPADLDADAGSALEGAGSQDGVLGPRGLLQPRRDPLLGLARRREQPVERVDQRRVGGVDPEGALHVRDGGVEVAVVLGGGGQRTQLVGDRGRVGDEPQPRAAGARGVDPARVELAEPHQLV